MTPGLWEGLADADGAGLRHNYGTAGDVPGLLRRCAGADRADAEAAAYDLENVLFHQGGWICPAAPAALSFLLRLAAAPHVRCRAAVLDLVVMLGRGRGGWRNAS